MAALELRFAQAGLTPADRVTTPLFGPAAGLEWHHSLIEEVFDFLLEVGGGLTTAESRQQYSLHFSITFRIYLACALYASGVPNDKIMAILRWRSEEALTIYARMNDSERTNYVVASMTARIDSVSTAYLPQLDPDAVVAAVRASLATGELGRAAKQADDGELADEDGGDAGSSAEAAHTHRRRARSSRAGSARRRDRRRSLRRRRRWRRRCRHGWLRCYLIRLDVRYSWG